MIIIYFVSSRCLVWRLFVRQKGFNVTSRRGERVVKSSKTFLFAAAVILFILGSSAQAYRDVIDLGTLGGDKSVACSINDSGQIVGDSGRACLFDPTGGGANIDLGSLGGSHSHAWSINNNGQIVGYAFTGFGDYRACLFDATGGGANTDLGTLGGYKSGAFSINDSGQIVGQAETPYPWWSDSYACIFDPTGDENNISIGTPDWIPIGYLSEAAAYSINDSGQIVGQQVSPISDLQVACLFYPENVWPLFLDDNFSSALFINNNAQIVGYSGISGLYSDHQACLFDPTGGGANTDLGTLPGYDFSEAWCINDSNQIVGYAYNDFLYPRACLFDPTGGGDNIDLNTLIDPSLSWTLQRAYSVNSDGWIVGVGINPDGYAHAYLLIPEPASAMIIALGGVFLSLRRRHH
jgi:probable HAF family extracellular repeat protein